MSDVKKLFNLIISFSLLYLVLCFIPHLHIISYMLVVIYLINQFSYSFYTLCLTYLFQVGVLRNERVQKGVAKGRSCSSSFRNDGGEEELELTGFGMASRRWRQEALGPVGAEFLR